MIWSIDKNLFFWLIMAFILATVVGTLSHESGHYLAAKFLGYDAKIHYGATSYKLVWQGRDLQYDSFLITLFGPVQTLFTGTVGLILLHFYKNAFKKTEALSLAQWTLIFLSLFWIRPSANFAMRMCSKLMGGKFYSFGDEIKIAKFFQLPEWSLLASAAVLGLLVLIYLIFEFIPIKQRITFMLSGLAGGISGYILWMKILGPEILP